MLIPFSIKNIFSTQFPFSSKDTKIPLCPAFFLFLTYWCEVLLTLLHEIRVGKCRRGVVHVLTDYMIQFVRVYVERKMYL